MQRAAWPLRRAVWLAEGGVGAVLSPRASGQACCSQERGLPPGTPHRLRRGAPGTARRAAPGRSATARSSRRQPEGRGAGGVSPEPTRACPGILAYGPNGLLCTNVSFTET